MAKMSSRASDVRHAVQRFKADTTPRGAGSAPIRLTFNDDNPADTRSVSRLFDGLGATLDSMADVLRGEGLDAIRAAFARNFDRQGERAPWPALAPSTIAQRIRLGYGAGPILRRTGALRRHVTTAPAEVRRTGTTLELRIAPGNVVAGRPKYRPLAMGTSRMPARPMVVLTPDSVANVTGVVSRALRNRARANGLG